MCFELDIKAICLEPSSEAQERSFVPWRPTWSNRSSTFLYAFVLSVAFCSLTPEKSSAQNSTMRQPLWSVDLKTYGWHQPKKDSNRHFFKDLTIGKLEALDINTRVDFLSNEMLVIYHTRESGQDYRTADRQLEAFFVNARDGSLAHTERWRTSLRKSSNPLRDSEGRLVPSAGGRFFVVANSTLMLYGSGLDLIKQRALEPSGAADLWAIQSVADGREVFLRHEPSLDKQTTYFWLASDTFSPLLQMRGFPGLNFSVSVEAGGKAVFTGSASGIRMIRPDGSTRMVCPDLLCRGDFNFSVLSSHLIAVSGRNGVGMADADHGLVWSRYTRRDPVNATFQFGRIRWAAYGSKFAVWATASRKTRFDGYELDSSPTILVYLANGSTRIPGIKIAPVSGDFDFALSPDGNKLVLFDGAKIRLYAIN